jgi:cytochrome P450
MQHFFNNIRFGAWLVDWIPALDYLPDALAPWRKQAVTIRNQIMPFFLIFYDQMKERIKNGTAPECFIASLLTDKASHFTEVEFSHIIGELITAGTETTATTLQWFFKAAVLYPESIKRAQEEIDRVVGPNRLPDWTDRPQLRYITALINELHRWATATPLAFFHATSEEDEYRGRNIPSGATVLANVYAIHNNPDYFPQPEKFIPERFLDQSIPGARPEINHVGHHFAFSVGRRECPGRNVADASLYIAISRILWAFNIKPRTGVLPGDGYSKFWP